MTIHDSGRNGKDKPDGEPISLFQLGRLLRDELDPEARAALEARIAERDPGGSYLKALESQGPARSWDSLQARFDATRARGPLAGFRRRAAVLAEAVASKWPRYALACVLICLGASLSTWTWRPSGPEPGGLAVKGAPAPEFALEINGVGCPGCGVLAARPGDTLSIRYRAPQRAFVQLWYRDDGGSYLPYGAVGAEARPWDPALAWTPGPGRIVLSPGWKEEEIRIVSAPDPFTREEARAFLETGRSRGGFSSHAYRLRAR
jgi:hypothetical protein